MDPTAFCSEASEDGELHPRLIGKNRSPRFPATFSLWLWLESPMCLAASVAVKSYPLAADRKGLVETVLNPHPPNWIAPRVR